ncbi:MAG: carboxypeptidase-like regulatory domain-containing protein [Candidatus Acidiferrales bacterium]
MTNLRLCGKGFCVRRLLSVLALLACCSTVGLGANNITGSVRNQSRGEPAAGDEVILVRLDRGMQEEARAKTDAQGAFTLNVQYPEKPYLVRVFHQGVSYDQEASAGETLSIQVFDAARRVQGVTGSIEILRTGTNGNLLHVSDMVEIKNESSPPLTQVGERTFEAYLPAAAKIDSVLAAGPEKIGVLISAAPVPGEPGHYAVNFPLRPGATKFAFNYDVPYDGHAAFPTRHAYPLQQLAVMIPPTIRFSSHSPAFEILATGNSRYQVQAANQLAEGEGPGFEVSGTGALPPLGDQAKSQALSRSPAVPNRIVSAPGRGALPSLASIDSRLKQTRSPSQSLVLGGVTSVLLAACALLVWRARKARSQDNRPQPNCKL